MKKDKYMRNQVSFDYTKILDHRSTLTYIYTQQHKQPHKDRS